jgi:hypothetical protein
MAATCKNQQGEWLMERVELVPPAQNIVTGLWGQVERSVEEQLCFLGCPNHKDLLASSGSLDHMLFGRGGL